jgi:hypothetical protein
MTHTKRKRKLAKAKIKADKAATAAQRARRVAMSPRKNSSGFTRATSHMKWW